MKTGNRNMKASREKSGSEQNEKNLAPDAEPEATESASLGEQDLEAAHARLAQRTAGSSMRVYLFAVRTGKMRDEDADESLEEVRGLLRALGDECVGTTIQRIATPNPATFVGAGKVEEIKNSAGTARADYVVCEGDLSPSQARNLEKEIGLPVLDRTGIILQIFERNARTRQARVQTAIAHLEYLQPRLANTWVTWDRQGGGSGGGSGGGAARGAGEKQKELDARKIRDRLSALKKELVEIQGIREVQRKGRRDELRVALVGYTNAGKTSLTNALTGSDLVARDALFETLDTAVRKLRMPSGPSILVTDTVGFIRDLPEGLVASFRSTLEETNQADLVLHVLDASSPQCAAQYEVTRALLEELGAGEVPRFVLFNKCDKIAPEELGARRAALAELARPHSFLFLSTKDPASVEACRDAIVEKVCAHFEKAEILLPHAAGAALGPLYAEMIVDARKDEEEGVRLSLRGPPGTLARILAKVPGAAG